MKYIKKTFRRRRATLAKRKPFYKTVRKIANSVVNKKQEVKSCMIAGTETSVSTLGGLSTNELLTNIAQGTSSVQRLGNKIKLIGIQIKYQLQNNGTVPVFVRTSLLKYFDRATIGTTSEMFLSTTGGSADISDLLSTSALMMRPYNPTFAKKYWDRVIKLSAYSGEALGSTRSVTKFIKFGKGLTVNYNGSLSTVGNIQPYLNFLVYAAEAGNDVGAGVTVEYTYQIRLFYTDA